MIRLSCLAPAFASAALLFAQHQPRRTVTWRGDTNPPPRQVTGAPYCADEVVAYHRIAGNGQEMSGSQMDEHVCRDAIGRIMREREVSSPLPGANPAPNMHVIEIIDPVAGFEYTLDLQHKVAHSVALALLGSPAFHPLRAPVSSVPMTSNSGNSSTRESLGTKTIDGVEAAGERITVIHGTDTMTVENWDSTALKIQVFMKMSHSDPARGWRSRRLENLTTTAPDAALFQVPSDFQVVNETAPFTLTYSRQ